MKNFIVIFFLINISFSVFGQSDQYNVKNDCILKIMDDLKLTGNDIFKFIKDECYLKNNFINKKDIGVLYHETFPEKVWKKNKEHIGMGNYIGEISYNLPNGIGTLFFVKENKIVMMYQGEWLDGLFHGLGSLRIMNDSFYGYWKNNKKDGYGRIKWSNGSEYVGEYKEDKFHGNGSLTFFQNGKKYRSVGEWRNDKGWNLKTFDESGNLESIWINGVIQR